MEENDTLFDDVMRKGEERQQKQRESKKNFQESVEKGEKKLIAEVTPSGLYTLRFEGGGHLPKELKGKFTSIQRVRALVVARYGKDILA